MAHLKGSGLFVYALLLAGCGGATLQKEAPPDASPPDGSPGIDSGEPTDANLEAEVDASTDAAVDAAPDAAPDAADASPDAADAGCVPSVSGYIAFDSDRDNFKRDIFIIRPDGTQLTRVTNDPGYNELEPAIAPDGIHMAYVSDQTGTAQIVVMNLQTRQTVALTNEPTGADEPSWSPDGTLVAFHVGNEEVGSVHTIHADGTGEILVMIDPELVEDAGIGFALSYEYPVFSADGLSLIADRSNQIQITHLDGTQARLLIPNGTYEAIMSAVSADGSLFAFVGDCGLTVTAFGDAQYCTASVATDAAHPSFGPQNILAFDQGTQGTPGEIMLGASSCGTPFNVTQDAADDRDPKWAPATFSGVTGVAAP